MNSDLNLDLNRADVGLVRSSLPSIRNHAPIRVAQIFAIAARDGVEAASQAESLLMAYQPVEAIGIRIAIALASAAFLRGVARANALNQRHAAGTERIVRIERGRSVGGRPSRRIERRNRRC